VNGFVDYPNLGFTPGQGHLDSKKTGTCGPATRPKWPSTWTVRSNFQPLDLAESNPKREREY
jgi:hypothetical protein